MSYSNPTNATYYYGEFDFGGGSAATFRIAGPYGMKGYLRDISVATSEVFATDTTTGSVEVGTVSDADAYGKLVIPDATATSTVFNKGDDTDAIISASIPADGVVLVTLTNGTDASAVTGKGFVSIYIDWY